MFAIIKITEEEKSLFARIKNKFSKQLPTPETVNVRGAAPFYYLEIQRSQCGKEFENIPVILGRCSKFIIPCNSTEITENSYIKFFKANKLPSIMLLNSALNILMKKHLNAENLSVGIIDKKAQFTQYLESFVKYAAIIKIYTENYEQYEAYCENVFEEYGVSVIVSSCKNIKYECDITVNTCEGFLAVKEANNISKLQGEGFNLSAEYEKLRPVGTDKLLFASALYELCGVKNIETVKFDTFNKIV